MKQIIGRKMGMTQVYGEDGTMYAVTVVEVLPNVVTQKKTNEKEGYASIQVGYEDKKEKNLNKCEKGIFTKANVSPKANLFELKGDEMNNFEVGANITVDFFNAGEQVDVIGTSKGRGFAGVIKRWGHKIGPKGHGSGYHRQMGSFANNGRCNNRVIPGKKMAGHMGNDQATILNARVIGVDATKNYILISGGVPGSKLSIITIRTAVKGLKHPVAIKPLMNRAAYDAAIAEKLAQEAAAKEAKKAEEKAKLEAEKKAAEEKRIAEQRAADEARAAEEAKKAAEEAAKSQDQVAAEQPAETKPADGSDKK